MARPQDCDIPIRNERRNHHRALSWPRLDARWNGRWHGPVPLGIAWRGRHLPRGKQVQYGDDTYLLQVENLDFLWR